MSKQEDKMLSLRKFVAPEIVFGEGALEYLAQYIANFGGRRVFIVTDRGVIDSGIVGIAVAGLDEAEIEYVVYSEVSENPRDNEVMAGVELYEKSVCDVIVAIGGGSPIDCAKAIGVVSTNKKHVLEFEGVDNVDVPGPPLFCVPTTAGSAADISQFAIINNVRKKTKIAIISKTMVPDIALIDPATTLTKPAFLTACTGLDVLTHAVEAYVSRASSPITDLHALKSIQLIIEFLPKSIEDKRNIASREQVMLASLHAGLAFSNASLGAVHAMAHSLGGLYDLAHGECNGLLLEHVVAYNYYEAQERYNRIADLFGLEVKSFESDDLCAQLVIKIREFRQNVGVDKKLREHGVTKDNIQLLSKNACDDPCMLTNPRHPSIDEVNEIFTAAW